MGQIFISYASADREWAKRLAEAMQAEGYPVWWDRNIAAGQTFDEVIEEALNTATCAVVLWSSASIKSDWVKTEAAEAASRRILVPALIEKVKIPLEFRRVQAADLTGWDGRSDDVEFQKFLKAVKLELEENAETLSVKAADRQGSPAPTPAAAPFDARPVHARPAPERPQTAPDREEVESKVGPAPRGGGGRQIWALAAVLVLATAAGVVFWLNRETGIQTPNLVGMPQANATTALNALALVPEVREHPSDTDAPGTIVGQDPPAGTTVAAGARIELTVATQMVAARPQQTPPAVVASAETSPTPEPAPPAVPQVAIPDLRGQTAERATELLANAGLTVGVTTKGASNDAALGTIISQTPDSSQTLAKGSPVEITVVARRTVPDLKGLQLKEARQALARLGLTERLERVRVSRGERDNQVVNQQPVPGTDIEAGGQSVLTVATTTPKTLSGGEGLFRTNGQRCHQVCKDAGLQWKGVWSGAASSCTCEL